MDGFTDGEADDHTPDLYLLRQKADEVHLHAGSLRVPECAVSELIELEVRAEVAVQTRQHVQVERRGDTLRVVVGSLYRFD